jgi:cyclopropane fatty-acyl-phospholipid synthase-like methyltransferase
LADLKLKQNAHFLDLECGQGAILNIIVKTLGNSKRSSGIDLWRNVDQSGNDLSIAKENAEIEWVSH